MLGHGQSGQAHVLGLVLKNPEPINGRPANLKLADSVLKNEQTKKKKKKKKNGA